MTPRFLNWAVEWTVTLKRFRHVELGVSAGHLGGEVQQAFGLWSSDEWLEPENTRGSCWYMWPTETERMGSLWEFVWGEMKAENRTWETQEWPEGWGGESCREGQGSFKKSGVLCVVKSHWELSNMRTQEQPVAFRMKQALHDWAVQWRGGDRSHIAVGWRGRSCWVGRDECKLLSGRLQRKIQKGSKQYLDHHAEGQRGFSFLRKARTWQMVKEKVRVVDNFENESWGTIEICLKVVFWGCGRWWGTECQRRGANASILKGVNSQNGLL